MALTKIELAKRIHEVAEEFGLRAVRIEVGNNETVSGELWTLEGMEDLPPDKFALLEERKYEITLDTFGNSITFKTEVIGPDDARAADDNTEEMEIERVVLDWDARDIKAVLALARCAMLTLPFIMSEQGVKDLMEDEEIRDRLFEAIQTDIPTPDHFMAAGAKVMELGEMCQHADRKWKTERDLAAIEDVTPEQIMGGEKE